MTLAPVLYGDDWDLSAHQPSEYMSGAFAHMLYAIPRFLPARTIVEVGVWKGLTSSLLCQAMQLNGTKGRVWGFDNGDFESEARDRIERLGFTEFWTYVSQDSAKAGQHWDDGPIDFLMVDAAHDYKSVVADMQAWMPHVAPRGYVFCHDYNPGTGVWRAVNEFVRDDQCDSKEYSAMPFHWEHGAMLLRRKGRGE